VRIELFAVLLMDHCDHYQELYAAVVEYYGENPRTLPPSTFFSLFVRFVKAFKVCDIVATCIDDLSFLHQPTTADGVFFWPLTLQRLFLCCDPPPLPPPVHIWDVMYVWRKGNIEKNCLCVTILCTIIIVHKGMSSSYRSVDCILFGLALCLQAPLCLRSSWCSIYNNFFCLHPSLSLSVSGAWWDWPLTWLTNHCPSVCDIVGWVIWPVKAFLKWPIMCRVGR